MNVQNRITAGYFDRPCASLTSSANSGCWDAPPRGVLPAVLGARIMLRRDSSRCQPISMLAHE